MNTINNAYDNMSKIRAQLDVLSFIYGITHNIYQQQKTTHKIWYFSMKWIDLLKNYRSARVEESRMCG